MQFLDKFFQSFCLFFIFSRFRGHGRFNAVHFCYDVFFAVYIEETAQLFDEVLVSAGQRGYDVRLSLTDLLAITGATPIRAN